MNVIFLDIDGVLNSEVFYRKRYNKRWFKPKTYWYEIKYYFKKIFKIKTKGVSLKNYKIPDTHYEFNHQFKRLKSETCREKWKWLSEFCNETDTKICISSTWKRHFYNKEGNLNEERWELALTKLGFKSGTFVGITGNRRKIRGLEIKEWLDNKTNIVDYAILDDDSDMLPEQMSKFHHCDSWFGMSPNHIYRIKRQFNKNI